jgi:hypothetical protein
MDLQHAKVKFPKGKYEPSTRENRSPLFRGKSSISFLRVLLWNWTGDACHKSLIFIEILPRARPGGGAAKNLLVGWGAWGRR